MTEWYPKDKVCIVGIGETEYTKWGQAKSPEFALACEAILKAIADAGLTVKDIDGIASYAYDRNDAGLLATTLGIPQLRFLNMYFSMGGSGCMGAVMNACLAVATGSANYVVVFRAIAQGQFGRYGMGRVSERVGGDDAFNHPYGCISPAQNIMAMQARRHMHEYGTTSRQFGAVAVACNKHAQQNPRAVFYGKPITIEDHQSSRIIDWPLRLYDYCLESDGATAIVVTSAERARDMKHPPVYIMSGAQGGGLRGAAGFNAPSLTKLAAEEMATDLFARAGITPKDIDVAQIFENFTPNVIMAIEDHGFCKRGEGGPFVEEGRIEWPDGELPINTSGGNLHEAYIHGFELVNEGVRQMRGTSTCQVKDAKTCLLTCVGLDGRGSSLIIRR